MNESEYQTLIEASWRRPLTGGEQAQLDRWLAAHPQRQRECELDEPLNDALVRLPDAPVSSNFTSLVMQAVAREQAAVARQPGLLDAVRGWFHLPAPRLAWALGLVAVGWFGLHQHQMGVRHELASGISVMANVTSLSDPGALEDFEAIQRLNANEDEELFAVLTAR